MAELREAPLNGGRPADGKPWVDFDVYRIPFFLEPDYPEDESWHESNQLRLERKWGGVKEFQDQKNRHRLKERGHKVGIEAFKLDRTASNTLQSHRLVQWAARNHSLEHSEALYDLLNVRHFVEGRKLNDRSMLLEAAAEVGLDTDLAAAMLETDEGKVTIQETYKMVQRMGINGIPTYVIDGGRHVLVAVKQDQLIASFREIEAEVANGRRSEDAAPVFGQMLGYVQ